MPAGVSCRFLRNEITIRRFVLIGWGHMRMSLLEIWTSVNIMN